MTNIYKNIYLRREEEVLYNMFIWISQNIIYYLGYSRCFHCFIHIFSNIIYMDVKLKMVTSYDATNVFVDTGYKNLILTQLLYPHLKEFLLLSPGILIYQFLQMRIQQLRQNQIFMKKIWMLNQKMGRNYC